MPIPKCSVRISPELVRKVDEVSKSIGCTRSTFIRMALTWYIKKHQTDEANTQTAAQDTK